MLDRLDETIVAISSAPGFSPVGIVRVTGPTAIAVVGRMARLVADVPMGGRPGATRTTGEVVFGPELSLPGDFYVFHAPHSYTRQDTVEIHTIGSPAALELVRRRAIELGALPAEPGEFTARAFLSGAMGLTEAEAVAACIRAQSDTQLRAARRVRDGALSREVKKTCRQLAELLALVEADIDFAEEPIAFITPHDLSSKLEVVSDRLETMLTRARTRERPGVLPHILLLGPPNTGKSSLMNRLSGTSRAICAAAAGTTRDILAAPFRLGRTEAILLDSAGVDKTVDDIIAAARDMALSQAERVDMVCLVVDVSQCPDEHVVELVRSLEMGPCIVAANMCDLVEQEALDHVTERLRQWRVGPVCPVSALHGTGLELLRGAMAEGLGQSTGTTLSEALVLSERQESAIHDAKSAIQRAIALGGAAVETIDCAELLAFELREALDTLGRLTGEVTTEDLLGLVFADFCIGK